MEDESRSAQVTNRVLGLAGVGGLVAVGAWVAAGPVVALVILLLLVVLVGGYRCWLQQRRRRASSQFQNSLSQEAAQVPREVKDPNRQADLDRLRKRFMDGIDVYRKRGKDLYSVPWFVIIGESGSGKTEAIRHSNLDFPAGLNEALQGSGGTINMDWWFTNQGVLLDTAGSMVFREVGGDSAGSPQWREFLQLLRKHRPNCPINGLVLVLSVDSLINDSAAKIAEKAARIARHLDLIQSTLDVRFPVSVLVTKCDKLTGFREFFEPIEDPELQDQMVGWSNPDSLDQPFRAAQVDKYLGQVVQRLRKRCLGLLRDPAPVGGQRARRADEVAALYALPKSLALIAPRLRRYLEAIFVAGEFTAKPVFVRGIYFTSAMQTGADLDEAVWKALGRPPPATDAPETAPGNLGRPFFLRHVFLEKVFVERGLVTRATNIERMLRWRKLTLSGAASAGLLLVLFLGLLGKWKLDWEIGKQSAVWCAASKGWEDDPWHPVVARSDALANPGIFRYAGATDLVGGPDLALADFHRVLRDSAERAPKVSLVFWPAKLFMGGGIEVAEREKAQRRVFERSVVFPLFQKTREKMVSEKPPGPSAGKAAPAAAQQQALKALLRLEADVARGGATPDLTNRGLVLTNYLRPCLSYLTETSNWPKVEDLAGVFVRTYAPALQSWPPAKLGGGDRLANNPAIAAGLARFFAASGSSISKLLEQSRGLSQLEEVATNFAAAEVRWFTAVRANQGVEERFLDLATAKRKLDEALERAGKSGLFALRDQTLAGHLADFRAQSESSGNEAVNRIQGALGDLPWTNSLRVDIQEKLKGFQQTLKAQAGLPPATETNLLKLDASLFRYCLGEDSLRSYARRFDAYTKAREFGQRSLPDMRQEVGKGWQFLTQIAQQAGAIGTSPDLYPRTCAYGAELRDTVKGLLEQGEASIRQNFVQEYARHVTGQVQGFADTPDFPVELATLEAAAKVLAGAARDSGSPPAQLEPAQVSLLDQLSERIKQTRIRLVDKFVSRASNELQAGLGFPVLRDAPKNLNVDELNGIRRTIAALDKSCASTVVQELERATGAESLKALKRRVETCRRVLDFLVDTSGNLRSFHVKVDPVDNQVEVLGRHRGMSVSRDGRGAEEKIDQGKEFPALALDQTMAIVSRPYPGSTEQPEVNNLAAWAPLRLLAAAGTSWKGASNHVWKWSFQIRKPAATAAYDLVPQDTLTVQFVFEKPLALLDDWPSSADW